MVKVNVLLTGGARGIGFAIKKRFEEEGCNVISPNREEMDLLSRDSVLTYLNNLKGPIDILINNAGINVIESFSEITIENLDDSFEVNTIAPFLLSQYCINNFFLKQNKGCIINIGTLWIEKNRVGRAAYTMAKVALESMTKSIAIEFGDRNIICNMISPGLIGTDLTYQNNTDKELKMIVENVPLKRLGTPEEIAELAVYLGLSNKLITGENIYIDGGISKSF
jgi:3-oxoacyl-[acyl-carrier protein] reductase